MKKHLTWLALAAGMLALASGTAWGQYQIRQGQALDANKLLGSGGLNQARPYMQYDAAANQIMTGNVTNGLSFRGYSPIRDGGAFFAGPTIAPGSGLLSTSATRSMLGTGSGSSSGFNLPSASLNGFQRDSYGIGDYRAGRAPYGGYSPYYSSATTILNAGSLVAGQNRTGTSQVRDPYQAPSALLASQQNNLLASIKSGSAGGNALAVPSRIVRSSTGLPVTGQVDYRLMSNPLFAGAFREVSSKDLADQISQPGQALVTAKPAEQSEQAASGSKVSVAQLQGPIDLKIKTMPQELKVSSEALRVARANATGDSRLQDVLARATQDGEYASGESTPLSAQGKTQLLGPKPSESAEAGGRGKPAAGAAGATDLYGWMRQKSEQLAMGSQVPFGGTPAGQAGPGGMPVGQGSRVPGGAGAALKAALANEESESTALTTFVGTETSALNAQLRYAEEALRAGKYYRAADAYSLASTVASDNPLPALGQCMALLAAGDYVSSAANLFDSIRLFGSLSEFQLDMKSFVQDVKVLDARRADLEKRLAMRDNGRLRFLLGFAEYSTGLKPLGVKNMRNGMLLLSDQDTDMTAVRRFVENLEGKVGIRSAVPAPSAP